MTTVSDRSPAPVPNSDRYLPQRHPWYRLSSIASQIRLGILTMVMLSVLPIGTALIYWSSRDHSEQTIQLQNQRSEVVANQIANYIDDLQRKLSYLARVKGLTQLDPAFQQALLEGLTRHNDAYEIVAIVDRQGQVVSFVSPYQTPLPKSFSDAALFQRSYRQQEEFVGTVALDPTTQIPMVMMAVPIRDTDDEVDGVLLALVNLSFLQYVVSQTPVGNTGYVYVLDERHYLIADSQRQADNFALADLHGSDLVEFLVQAEEGEINQYSGLNQEPVLGAVTPVRSVSWKVVVELPTREAYAPLYRMVMVMGGATVGLLALAIAAGWFMSNRLTASLRQLTQAAVQISQGHLDTQVHIQANNELGILARTFNHMASQVKASVATLAHANEDLENRVAERTAALQTALEAADTANRAKSEFLANMNHELRTPLNGILGYAQILSRDSTLTPKQQQGVGIIHQCGSHLLTLINDILDLAKIEARKMELYPQDFHLPNFLLSTAEICAIKARQKGIGFEYCAPDNLPTAIHADDKRLRQVLLNLLSNAIKFTDIGQVSLRVEHLEGDEKDNNNHVEASGPVSPYPWCRIRFTVQDTGIGIPPERLKTVFHAFEQAGGRDRNAQGTGLGLAISQQIVQMMGTELQVESTVGQGSSFWFKLELPLAHDWPAMAEDGQVPIVVGYRGRPYTILVVDDHPENQLVVINMLEPLGFQVKAASNGREGYEQARQLQPDLIITDVIMPELNGLEMTQKLRQLPEFSETPIIASPASLSQVERHESLAAGCNSFFPKPIQLNALLAEIATWLALEWVYDTDSTPSSLSTATTAQTQKWQIPPPENLNRLYQAAQGGFIQDIQQEAMQIRELGADYSDFANHVLDLAQEFDDEAILRLIETSLRQ